ncbi:MAG: YchJ family metal-binding protein [Cyanobacteria bacterium P01_G01_bin.54]
MLSHCCGPYLQGQRPAPTAEQLMRSRYSAYCTKNIDYLVSTHHPDYRQPHSRRQIAATASCATAHENTILGRSDCLWHRALARSPEKRVTCLLLATQLR